MWASDSQLQTIIRVCGQLGLLVSNFADHGKIGKDELDELYAILDKAADRGE